MSRLATEHHHRLEHPPPGNGTPRALWFTSIRFSTTLDSDGRVDRELMALWRYVESQSAANRSTRRRAVASCEQRLLAVVDRSALIS